MSFFSGINKVNIGTGRPENIREGEYVLSVSGAKAFVSRKGHDSVVVEFRVSDASKTGDFSPNRQGSMVRAFFKLERDRHGDLNEDGMRWMARLKTLLANILGGDERVDENGEFAPVTDEEVTPLIAASIIKGTEYRINDIGPDIDKRQALMLEVATAATKDGGLSMSEDEASAAIDQGELNFADVRGLKLRCRAKANEKGFVNLYWRPHTD